MPECIGIDFFLLLSYLHLFLLHCWFFYVILRIVKYNFFFPRNNLCFIIYDKLKEQSQNIHWTWQVSTSAIIAFFYKQALATCYRFFMWILPWFYLYFVWMWCLIFFLVKHLVILYMKGAIKIKLLTYLLDIRSILKFLVSPPPLIMNSTRS